MNDNNIDDLGEELDELDSDITDTDSNKIHTSVPEPFRNPLPKNSIGHITATNTGLKIGRDENIINASIHPNERDSIQVGDYIRVPYYVPDKNKKDEDVFVEMQLLASIESLVYNTQLEDQRYTNADNFGSEQYQYFAKLNPISIIRLKDNWKEQKEPFVGDFVSTPPRPTVRLDKVEENEFLRCGLDIPREGIYVGDMSVNGNRVPNKTNPLEYYLFNPTTNTDYKGEPSIFRHVLVAGSTGTGKTHTSKNILRQFAQKSEYKIAVPSSEQNNSGIKERTRALNITIIDPEEEYAEMGQDPKNMKRAKELAEARNGLQYGGIGDGDIDFKVFAPQTKNSSNKELNTKGSEVINFGIPFEIVHEYPALMMPNDPQGPTRQLIKESIGDYFNSAIDDYSKATFVGFKQWFETEYELELVEEGTYNESIINAAKRRVLYRSEYYDVFDNSKSLLDTDIVDNMFEPGQVSVITTGHLRGSSEQLVIQAISSHIVENKISSDVNFPQIKGTPLVLALDEAHEYVNEPETTRERFIVDKFRRAARRGRKDKFGLYFISQNPEDIDGEARNQFNTKIYLQLDRRVVESPDVYIPREYKNQLPQFDKGQMVVTQPDVNPVELMGLDTCLTKHSK